MPKPCLDCGTPTNGTRCLNCTRQQDAARRDKRGTTTQRGYGARHQRLRQWWTTRVATGEAICNKCGEPITPGTAWDLGHTDDRTGYTGPEHDTCNRSAGGNAAH